MLQTFFATMLPQVLNMSLTGSLVIVLVLALRLLLKKAPKIYSYALWAVVLFRLLCPVSFSAPLSLLGLVEAPTSRYEAPVSSVEYIRPDTDYVGMAVMPDTGTALPDTPQQNLPQAPQQNGTGTGRSPLQPEQILIGLWLSGALALLVYSLVSLLRLRRRLVGAVPLEGNIYLADGIDSPFVMGLFRPRIYLPSSLAEGERGYIILHEKHHIRRGDHLWKLLSFAALCIHWFNPLVWLAFVLSARDMEMSCDEAVLKKLGADIRADYSASLLALATGRRIIAGAPLAFGEGNTRGRIKNLLNWKKPARWLSLVCLLLCTAAILFAALNPAGKQTEEDGWEELELSAVEQLTLENAIQKALLERDQSTYPGPMNMSASFLLLGSESEYEGTEKDGELRQITLYGLARTAVFGYTPAPVGQTGGTLRESGGSHIPTVLTFAVEDGGYTLTEYWIPRDGSLYAADIREKFPRSIAEEAMDTQKYELQQTQECYARIIEQVAMDPIPTIEALLQEMESSPAESSNPGAYVEAHPLAYRELLYYGDYTLTYIFSHFLGGYQVGLRGHIMRFLLDDLVPELELKMYAMTGQEYFEEWKRKAQNLGAERGMEWLQENQPAAAMLLRMSEGQGEHFNRPFPENFNSRDTVSYQQHTIVDGQDAVVDLVLNPGLWSVLQDCWPRLQKDTYGRNILRGSQVLLTMENGDTLSMAACQWEYLVVIVYTHGGETEHLAVNDPYLHIYLSVLAESSAVELIDCDQDGFYETWVYLMENNTTKPVTYDFVGGRVLRTEYTLKLTADSASYAGNIANIKEEYRNAVVADGKLYSYKDGELTYLCPLSEGLNEVY